METGRRRERKEGRGVRGGGESWERNGKRDIGREGGRRVRGGGERGERNGKRDIGREGRGVKAVRREWRAMGRER